MLKPLIYGLSVFIGALLVAMAESFQRNREELAFGIGIALIGVGLVASVRHFRR